MHLECQVVEEDVERRLLWDQRAARVVGVLLCREGARSAKEEGDDRGDCA